MLEEITILNVLFQGNTVSRATSFVIRLFMLLGWKLGRMVQFSGNIPYKKQKICSSK